MMPKRGTRGAAAERTACTSDKRAGSSLDSVTMFETREGPLHLIVQANGLFGYPGNWTVMNEHLSAALPASHYLIHSSHVNQKTQTFDGIDACGDRLAREIAATAAAHPTLKYISFMGHSMGGLMLRYAAGKLFDPDVGLIAGLQPAHFITLATPHLGCDASGESQVPFVGWAQKTPLVGRLLHPVLSKLSVPVSGLFFGVTGRQFFMADPPRSRAPHPQSRRRRSPLPGAIPRGTISDAPTSHAVEKLASETSLPDVRLPGTNDMPDSAWAVAPLLLRLAHDHEEDGCFYSALASFRSRTCYANAGNDHLVGWANSSLRFKHELPRLDLKNRRAVPVARGVVREDPVHAAFFPSAAQQPRPPPAAARGDFANNSAALGQRHTLAPGVDGHTDGARTALSHPRRDFQGCEGQECGDKARATDLGRAREGCAASCADDLQGAPYGGAAEPAAARPAHGAQLSASSQTLSHGVESPGRVEEDTESGLTPDVHVEQALEHPELDFASGSPTLDNVVASSKAVKTAHILHVLQALPWSRIDCAWRDARMSLFAHNLIQVTRVWINWEGRSVCKHVANRFVNLERALAVQDDSYEVGLQVNSRNAEA